MCCSNWNSWSNWNGWNGRRCACRCVCWGPFGTQMLADSGSAAPASPAVWPECAGADWAGSTSFGCNG